MMGSPHGTVDPDIEDYFAWVPPRYDKGPSCVLCCVTVRENDPVQQCNARSLRAVWSSRETTLNPDRGSGSSVPGFSARVESPNKTNILLQLLHCY